MLRYTEVVECWNSRSIGSAVSMICKAFFCGEDRVKRCARYQRWTKWSGREDKEAVMAWALLLCHRSISTRAKRNSKHDKLSNFGNMLYQSGTLLA